jgi:predicted transcriptional regulator
MTINFFMNEFETLVACAVLHSSGTWGQAKEIGAEINRNHKSVNRILNNLVKKGVLKKDKRGIYKVIVEANI